jgi:hypothetical protein
LLVSDFVAAYYPFSDKKYFAYAFLHTGFHSKFNANVDLFSGADKCSDIDYTAVSQLHTVSYLQDKLCPNNQIHIEIYIFCSRKKNKTTTIQNHVSA